MSGYAMPPETARALLAALTAHDVSACVGGGWGVDALVGEQTRPHADLDLWADAVDLERLFTALASEGVDRVYPWPGDRPWNFVMHDGVSRRVDLHLYERLDQSRLHYGSVTAPFIFHDRDISGQGEIAGMPVRCEAADFALANRAGYELRDTDRHDIAVLRRLLGLTPR